MKKKKQYLAFLFSTLLLPNTHAHGISIQSVMHEIANPMFLQKKALIPSAESTGNIISSTVTDNPKSSLAPSPATTSTDSTPSPSTLTIEISPHAVPSLPTPVTTQNSSQVYFTSEIESVSPISIECTDMDVITCSKGNSLPATCAASLIDDNGWQYKQLPKSLYCAVQCQACEAHISFPYTSLSTLASLSPLSPLAPYNPTSALCLNEPSAPLSSCNHYLTTNIYTLKPLKVESKKAIYFQIFHPYSGLCLSLFPKNPKYLESIQLLLDRSLISTSIPSLLSLLQTTFVWKSATQTPFHTPCFSSPSLLAYQLWEVFRPNPNELKDLVLKNVRTQRCLGVVISSLGKASIASVECVARPVVDKGTLPSAYQGQIIRIESRKKKVLFQASTLSGKCLQIDGTQSASLVSCISKEEGSSFSFIAGNPSCYDFVYYGKAMERRIARGCEVRVSMGVRGCVIVRKKGIGYVLDLESCVDQTGVVGSVKRKRQMWILEELGGGESAVARMRWHFSDGVMICLSYTGAGESARVILGDCEQNVYSNQWTLLTV